MNLFNLLGTTGIGGNHDVYYATSHVVTIINIVMNTLMGLFSALAFLFLIYIGFRLAKAEDESKRKEAKKQMIYTIVAIVGVIVLIVLFNVVIEPQVRNAFSNEGFTGPCDYFYYN